MEKFVRNFFDQIDLIWAAIPSPVKVFLYSSISSAFGLWVAGELSMQAVAIIVMTNMGLYSGPRQIKRMVK